MINLGLYTSGRGLYAQNYACRLLPKNRFIREKPHILSDLEEIDKILKIYSGFLFSGLEKEDSNILRWLAKNGPQNLTQLGGEFRRWSVKRRLNGSKCFLGLIPNEFVYPIPVNGKETRYDLTMKGLLAVLDVVRFENIHLVKTYKKFLQRMVKKTKLVNWSLDFIKHEIALILGYNYLQGLDWTRFKLVEWYWENLDEKDMMSEIMSNPIFFRTDYSPTKYDEVKNEYLKLFFILNLCTVRIPLGQHDSDVLDSDLTGRKYVHKWYYYLNPNTNTESLKNKQQYNAIVVNFQKKYKTYLKSVENEAREIVLRNGYEISGKN